MVFSTYLEDLQQYQCSEIHCYSRVPMATGFTFRFFFSTNSTLSQFLLFIAFFSPLRILLSHGIVLCVIFFLRLLDAILSLLF